MKVIEYKSNNGYTGRMYGKSSLSIYESESGEEVFHTGFRKCNSLKDLRKQVEEFPKLLNATRQKVREKNDHKRGKEGRD